MNAPPLTSLADRFRQWYAYEKAANRRALEMIASVPQEQQDNPLFQKAVDKLAHVFSARRLWLGRFGNKQALTEDLFPDHTAVGDLPRMYDEVYAFWDPIISELDDARLAGEFEYRSTDGEHFRSRIEDILIQLHGHALYHRGQVATLVAMCGGTAVDTDYVYWTRQPVAPAAN